MASEARRQSWVSARSRPLAPSSTANSMGWCIVDLVGKHGRVRTIPMPTWVKVAIDTWTVPTGISDGHVLRRVSRGDVAHTDGMSEKVVWQLRSEERRGGEEGRSRGVP